MKKYIFIISIIVTSIFLSVGMFFVIDVFKIRPSDDMGTKEDIIRYFEENQELFEEIIKEIEKNEYGRAIYGDWVSRDGESNLFTYYKDTQSESIIKVFSNEEWYLDNISIKKETEKIDECIIFTQYNSSGYDYWGVYYVENDELIGWDGQKRFKPTEKKGAGYLLEKDGCRYYTERICESWWYFQANY